ncbi:hypothetical protein Riv7116_6624 [Rivularia sp. PCC 7116]|uniref:hypothetical protein n=1 Tax=Rivularia sp. PCC 7116 TaxID=373994 RepID=UPI00029F495E|nr:hypothetical protein [Rivularia sp. PCC 7116]AFY58950.1 hypothetical protein Riv7116_6624 [Rivularia sp. PCC 7116]
MSEHDEFKKFLPDEGFESPPIVYEVPSQVETPYQERIPSGYEPMSEIELRGRAYRGLSGGRIPWWVMMTGWMIFGGFAFAILIPAIASLVSGSWLASVALIPALLIASIFLTILWRGTNAKLSVRKNQSSNKN